MFIFSYSCNLQYNKPKKGQYIVDISYVIREKNDKNRVVSEAITDCPFMAAAELLLKTRLKNILGGEANVYVLHKRNAYQHAAMFITVHFQFQYQRDIFLEIETVRERAKGISWSPISDPIYLENEYAKKVALFVNKVKKFTSNRSLVLPILIVFAVKNDNHLFWQDLQSAESLGLSGIGRGHKKSLKR